MSQASDRDSKQKKFGCIGFSMMAHAGVLTLLALAPHAANEPFGTPEGNAGGAAAFVDFASPGSAPEGAGAPTAETTQIPTAQEATQEAPKEVMLAQANDETGVPVPAETKPVETTPVEAKPVVESKPIEPKPIVETKPIEKLPEHKPKVKKNVDIQKPAKVAVAKSKVAEKVAPEKGDVAVREALSDARKNTKQEVTEERPARLVEKVDAEADDTQDEQANAQTDTDVQAYLRSESGEDTKEEASNHVAEEPVTRIAEPVIEEPEEKIAKAPVALPIKEAADEAPVAQNSGFAAAAADTAHASEPQAPSNSSTGTAGGQGTGSGAAARAGGGSGYGIPLGVQIRDANMLREAAGNRPPVYPMEEKLRHKEGTAVIVARVKTDGSIAEVRLERSSGSTLIDQSAIQAYKNWRYLPGQEGWVRKGFLFRLTGEAKINPAQLRRQ